MNVYIPQIVAKSTDIANKAITLIPNVTPQEVSDAYDLAIKTLTDAKANYLANPSGTIIATSEQIFDDALVITELVLDIEGKTTWSGYIADAEGVLQFVINHPTIANMVTKIGNLFKKKVVATLPTATTPDISAGVKA